MKSQNPGHHTEEPRREKLKADLFNYLKLKCRRGGGKEIIRKWLRTSA
jgi:hypothetical protein